jgi:hypothetical protein
MRQSRYILDAENRAFLDAIVETSAKRKRLIKKDAVFWRAQLGHDWQTEIIRGENEEEIDSIRIECPYSAKRMIPLADRAYEGRVNPKGIPCLYCSNDRETAMKETRPWIGSLVSVSQVVTLKELSVVDCSHDSHRWDQKLRAKEKSDGGCYLELVDPEPGEWEKIIWSDINRAFSEPVNRTDDTAEYAPTQVLSEAFRMAGFDGIAYGSKLGKGKTVAIFDISAVKVANGHLYKVDDVDMNFSMAANSYYVGESYKTKAGG